MEYTILTPDTFVITRGKDADLAEVTVDVTKLDEVIMAKLAMHGLKQKVADAAAGAAKYADENEMTAQEAAFALMSKVVDRLEAGEWGAERGAGGGVNLGFGSAVDAAIISIMRQPVKEADKAWYKNAKEADRKARCVEAFEGLDDAKREAIAKTAEARVERDRIAAAETAALGIQIDL